jgi:hypothetical protein
MTREWPPKTRQRQGSDRVCLKKGGKWDFFMRAGKFISHILGDFVPFCHKKEGSFPIWLVL